MFHSKSIAPNRLARESFPPARRRRAANRVLERARFQNKLFRTSLRPSRDTRRFADDSIAAVLKSETAIEDRKLNECPRRCCRRPRHRRRGDEIYVERFALVEGSLLR